MLGKVGGLHQFMGMEESTTHSEETCQWSVCAIIVVASVRTVEDSKWSLS